MLASAVLAAAGGVAIARMLDLGHPAVWAILLATGSAAIVLPALQEAGVSAEKALLAMAWATVADIATIVAVPLVLRPSHALRAGLGALAVAGGAVLVLGIARVLAREHEVHRIRLASKERMWALDLRVALVFLFGLCALAQWVGTSIMIAGFAAGLVVAVEGGPHRLSTQVSGVANGFLVPVFFVVLGASLNVRTLVSTPSNLALAVALIVGMVLVHVLAGPRHPRAGVDGPDRHRAARCAGRCRQPRPCRARDPPWPRGRDHPRGARQPRAVRRRHRDGQAGAERGRTRIRRGRRSAGRAAAAGASAGDELREPTGDGVARRRRILAGDLEAFGERPESFDEL